MTSRLLPGERVQDPFLVLEVETRRGDDPHTMSRLGIPGREVETGQNESQFLPEFEAIGEGVAMSEEGEGTATSLFATRYSLG